MKKNHLIKSFIASTFIISVTTFAAENNPDDFSATSDTHAEQRINKSLEEFKAERKTVEKNLKNFDDLDFNVYTRDQ